MSNIAIVENNIITNVIVAEIEWAKAAFPNSEVIICPEGVGVGWSILGGEWSAPPAGEPTPTYFSRISRRQGLIALYREEGVRDTDIQNIIDAIEDPSSKYEAELEFMNATWEIDNPWVNQFATALGLSQERLQELFNIASTL